MKIEAYNILKVIKAYCNLSSDCETCGIKFLCDIWEEIPSQLELPNEYEE